MPATLPRTRRRAQIAERLRRRIDDAETIGPIELDIDRRFTPRDHFRDRLAESSGRRDAGAAASAGHEKTFEPGDTTDDELAIGRVHGESGNVMREPPAI